MAKTTLKRTLKSLTSIDPKCHICGGSCWHGEDQKRTQAEALAKFGIIPNHCVNGEGGVVHCPAALGLLKN